MAGGQSPKAARFALIGAAAILVAAVAYASFRDSAPAPKPAATPAAPVEDSIETLEARAKAAPGDARAWAALGIARAQRDENAAAAEALERAARLAPGRAQLWSALGEARAKATADPMPPAAIEAFRKALAIDPKDPPARYYMAVARDLKGDHQGAIEDWLALLADTPPGAPWEADLRRTIEQVGAINKIDVASRLAAVAQPTAPIAPPGLPGPDADQLRAAAALPPSQQEAMARGMVDRLEARLKADPSNLDGWGMLMRSRMNLGEPAKASAALKAAVAANPGAKARLEGEARALGVPTS
ncbi:MAG: tetratricopeptide repeat protein [Sphingomonas sp.]